MDEQKQPWPFYLKFIALCIVAAIISGVFSVITDSVYNHFKSLYLLHPYLALIYVPTVFAIIAFLMKRYFPYTGGSGLPQGYAIDVFSPEMLQNVYSLRTMWGKMLLTIMTIGSGAALGREGPTVQICASILSAMNTISLTYKKLLIRIGSGIGIATAFNTPLGGVMFAFEEYLKESRFYANLLLLLGIAIASSVSIVIYGNYSYMGEVPIASLACDSKTILLAIISGIICGLSGTLFTW